MAHEIMRSKFAPKYGNQGKNGTESIDSVEVQGNPKSTNPIVYSSSSMKMSPKSLTVFMTFPTGQQLERL